MYKLHFTTKDFIVNGNSIENIPLLVKEDMSFEEIPTKWFMFLALENSSTSSPDTWSSYAEVIYDWFQVCHYNQWNWKDIKREHLISYRNNMVNRKSAFDRPYSKSTINGYVKRICFFYQWCFDNKHVSSLPFNNIQSASITNFKNSMLLGHTKDNNNFIKNDLVLKTSKKIPYCISQKELSALLSNLKERDALMVKWSALTGMRRKEVLGLTIRDIPRHVTTNSFIQKIEITVTKGSKARYIYVPTSLIDETNEYIKLTRRQILIKNNLLNNIDALWINQINGQPISNKGLVRNFNDALNKSNFRCTFHHLRHTYAIKMLSILTKQSQNNGLNPLKTLQLLLGHANIATTMIYLEALSINAHDIEDSLTHLYKDLIE